MIGAISHEKTLKLGVFDETSGVIRATTSISFIHGWGEIININITDISPNSCRVKVQSVAKGVTAPFGKNEQNCALIFRILDFALSNPGQFI